VERDEFEHGNERGARVSRFFEILRKSQELADDLHDGDLQSIPIEGELEDPIEKDPENVIKSYDPSQIPVQNVQIQPASRMVFDAGAMSPGADRFRFLRLRLGELWTTRKLRTLLITSPLPGDGKSTIAMNLATTLAEHGQRPVLLIEADLHHPTLTHQLGIEAGHGLAECLQDGLSPLSAVRRLEPLGWYLLSSGKPGTHPTELLLSEALPGVMQELSPYFDWVLIDSPPVIPLTDALSLGRQADASLVVVWAGRTPREAVEQTVNLLGPKHVLGILLNGVEGLHKLYSKYYGYYDINSSSRRVRNTPKEKESSQR